MGLSQHFNLLMSNGIDSLAKLLNITDESMNTMQLQDDHRETILRAVTLAKLIKGTLSQSLSEGRDNDSFRSEKRKYQRHPKKDSNAPQLPPTAYVVFSNEFREKHVVDQAAFTEIARAVGQAWKSLPSEERNRRETEARVAREEYRRALEAYKQTDSHKEYIAY